MRSYGWVKIIFSPEILHIMTFLRDAHETITLNYNVCWVINSVRF